MSSDIPSDRDRALRDVLVATAAAEGRSRRPSRGRIALAIGAFAAAGALTGAAIATTTLAAADQADKTFRLRAEAEQQTKGLGALIGAPVVQDATGGARLRFESAEPSATRVVIAFECFGNGPVVASTADDSETVDCTVNTPAVVELAMANDRDQTVTVAGGHDVRILAWASRMRDRPVPSPSTQQELELSDGKITHQEYLAAYSRYAGCMGEAGYPMAPISGEPPFVFYAVPTAAVDAGADSTCYYREFRKVDTAWQLALASINSACLAAHGVDASKLSLEDQLAQLRRIGMSLETCSPGQR